MKLFKYFLPFFLLNIIYAQDCIKGDCIDGYGEKKWKSSLYKGSFKGGRMYGAGEYTWTSGGSYIGTFREDFFEGKGIRRYKNSTIYEGEFKYDKRHGKGEIKYPSGSSYSGKWHFDYRHGFGFYKNGKGYSYEGNYRFNKKQGFGKEKWLNGDMYEGSFKNDYKEGYGVYTWTSGETYKGNWKNGKKHGFAISEKNDQILKKGIWYNGVHTSNETGCIDIGQECLKNRLCCKIKYENSEILFSDSRKTMVPIENLPAYLKTYPNAKKRYFYDEKWKKVNAVRSKYYRLYSELDSLTMTYSVKSYYTKNDKLQWSGNIRNNNLSVTNCEDALCEGNTYWYNEDGKLSSEGYYLEGRRHGKHVLYFRNGEKLETNYDRGKYLKTK
jgi:hypothetical protein